MEDHKARRERIATKALEALITCPGEGWRVHDYAYKAVSHADALIAELDKPTEASELDRLRARVAELEEAIPTDEELAAAWAARDVSVTSRQRDVLKSMLARLDAARKDTKR